MDRNANSEHQQQQGSAPASASGKPPPRPRQRRQRTAGGEQQGTSAVAGTRVGPPHGLPPTGQLQHSNQTMHHNSHHHHIQQQHHHNRTSGGPPAPQHSLQLMQPIHTMPTSQAHRYHHSTSHPIYQPRPTHPPPAAMAASPLAASSGHTATALHQHQQQQQASSIHPGPGLQQPHPHQHQHHQQQVQLAVIGGRYRPLTTLCLGGELLSVPQVVTQDVSGR